MQKIKIYIKNISIACVGFVIFWVEASIIDLLLRNSWFTHGMQFLRTLDNPLWFIIVALLCSILLSLILVLSVVSLCGYLDEKITSNARYKNI